MPRGRPRKDQTKAAKPAPKKKAVKQSVEEKDSDYLSVLMREQSENVLFQQKFWHDKTIPAWRRWIKKILGI